MKISVITVSYNSATTIGDTLRSVIQQDWDDYEHIIVDGGSTDGTLEVIEAHAHQRLRWSSGSDAGCYDAMNKGLRQATGDIVSFLNSDDFFARPDALRLVAHAFEHNHADCVVGQTAVVDRNDARRVRRLYRSAGFQPWMLRFGHMPPHPSFFARREQLLDLGGFDTSFRISGDFDQMVRLLLVERADLVRIPQTLTGFRTGGLSTNDLRAKLIINQEILRSLAKNGIKSNQVLLWARYPFKAAQLLRRPRDYPAYLGAVGIGS